MTEMVKALSRDLTLKDLLYIMGLGISFVFQYLTMYREHDVRIVVLETQMFSIGKVMEEVRLDVKTLLQRKQKGN
jgi:hypothetical protein